MNFADLFQPRRDKFASGLLAPPEPSIVGLNQFSDNEAGYGAAQSAPPKAASLRLYTPPPSVQAGYDIGAKLDPGTPGDKREIYRQGARLNTAAGLLAPPIGAAQGLLDLEHTTHDYSTGKAGISDVAMAAPGALGIAGKLPRLRGGYHGTSSPDDFSSFIKSKRDMGVHISTDPNVARGYAMGDYSPNKFLYDWATLNNAHPTIPVAGPRTMPVVADIRNPMRYPGDPINWQSADNVLSTLEGNMAEHSTAGGPNYIKLLKDLEKVEGQSGNWEGNFYNYMKDRNIDAVQYPHTTKGKDRGFNAFMALDPEQVLPKFSPEGIALAKERGVIRPGVSLQWNPMDQMYWDLKNQGIMGKKAEEIIKSKGSINAMQYNADAIDKQLAGGPLKSLFDEFGGSEEKLKKYYDKDVKGNISGLTWEEFLKTAKEK